MLPATRLRMAGPANLKIPRPRAAGGSARATESPLRAGAECGPSSADPKLMVLWVMRGRMRARDRDLCICVCLRVLSLRLAV